MRKGIKILGKVLSAAVLLLIILPLALSLLLDIPAVQNYVVQKAVRMASKKLETTVSIDRVDIGLFSRVKIKGFYVEDYQRDTLLYVGRLDAFVTGLGIFGGGLALSRGEIADAKLYLRETPGGEMNIKQIVNRISNPDKPKKGNFRLSLRKASIENMDLCLERLDRRDPEFGIDFSHMHLYGITAYVNDFTIDGQSIYTTIETLSARERSGFALDRFAGRFYLTNGCMGFEDVSVVTGRSNVQIPYISLAGDSWAEYKDFIGEVRIDGALRNTTVSTDDIAYFAPKLRGWHTDFSNVNVEVAGVVADFTAKVKSMQIGEGTWLIADASVRGLPDIRQTRFDLNVPRLKSSAEAVDELAAGIGGRELSDKLVGILGNTGQIDINARFKGLLSSFDMQLGASTGVGEVTCNLRMTPLKAGRSSVRGDVETHNLRLGELLGRRDLLGNATLSAYIDGVVGKGYTDANVVGNVTQLGFNDYIYDSLRLDGRLRNRQFDGRITARDPNLDFDFSGLVDFNDSIPRYDFTMDLRHADLARLHINRRDSVSQLAARIEANAGGTLAGRPERPYPRHRRRLPLQRQADHLEDHDRHGRELGAEQTRRTALGLRRRHVPQQDQLPRSLRIPAPQRMEIPAPAAPRRGRPDAPRPQDGRGQRLFAAVGQYPSHRPHHRRHHGRPADRRRVVDAAAFQSGQRPAFAQGDVGIRRAQTHAGHTPEHQRLQPGRLAHGLRFGRGSLRRGAAPAATVAHGRRQAGAACRFRRVSTIRCARCRDCWACRRTWWTNTAPTAASWTCVSCLRTSPAVRRRGRFTPARYSSTRRRS